MQETLEPDAPASTPEPATQPDEDLTTLPPAIHVSGPVSERLDALAALVRQTRLNRFLQANNTQRIEKRLRHIELEIRVRTDRDPNLKNKEARDRRAEEFLRERPDHRALLAAKSKADFAMELLAVDAEYYENLLLNQRAILVSERATEPE